MNTNNNTQDQLQHITEITPAFDRRDPDPQKDYGIHGCDLKMLVKGSKGTVQFVIYTNWYLPHVTEELFNQPIQDLLDIKCRFLPLPADLGYHSPVPQYKDQHCMGPCKYLDGKKCYYDGSGLDAYRIYNILVEKGSDEVWKELELYYHQTFDEEAITQ